MSVAYSSSPRVVRARYQDLMEFPSQESIKLTAWNDEEDFQIHKNLTDPEVKPEKREHAKNLIELMMHEMSNKLVKLTGGMLRFRRDFANITKQRQKEFQLSTFGAFPDTTKIGIPRRIIFSDTDQEGVDTRFLNLVRIEDVRIENRAATNMNYQVLDVDHGSIWQKLALGAPRPVHGVSSGMLEGKLDYWSAGYQFLEVFEQFQDVWSNDMGARYVAREYVDQLRKEVESVICDTTNVDTGAALTPLAYPSSGANQAENDLLLLDGGITEISTQMYNELSADEQKIRERRLGATEPVYVVYNSTQAGFKQRWPRVVAQRFEGPNDNISLGELDRPVIPYGDVDIPLGNQVMLVAGRRKLLHVIGRDIMFESVRDAKVAGVSRAELADALNNTRLFSEVQRRLLATS